MMKNFLTLLLLAVLWSCGAPTLTEEQTESEDTATTAAESDTGDFVWQTEKFADLGILRYKIPGFEKLSTQQKALVYYLTQAGLAGRDIMYDQNYRHNLNIRRALDKIVQDYKGDKSTSDWNNFMEYTKRVWFSNGIHHHYSNDKFTPKFSQAYFEGLLKDVGATVEPEAMKAIFDANFDNKKVNLDVKKGLVEGSAVNFYGPNVTTSDVENYYKKIMKKGDERPISYGLNSQLIKLGSGKLAEKVYSADGMYGAAIREIIKWLEKAKTVAENDKQAKAFDHLIEYYRTGNLKAWDDYNVAWCGTKEGDIDYINGFVEVYNDPMGYSGSYETIVEITDFDASARMKVLADNAQWFEDNSTIMDEHKKKNVTGVSYKVVTVAGEAGDASPSTPIGVNLPNANWIRKEHGSKSVSLGNIIAAYNSASGPGMLSEFANDEEEIERIRKYGELGDKMGTALHEVIGHASGQINPGVGTPKETLKSYASTIEEARADIIALYFIMDQKMVDLGLIPSLDVAKAEYDGYISNGLMKQLRRLEPGKDIEESHMRNRQLIAAWVYEKGQKDNVISKEVRDGKTYFNINDYDKLRKLFGDLLIDLQRLTSEGDYEAGKNLVEKYGVKVDQALHKEVLERTKKLDLPAYRGFINPELVAVTDDNGKITDVKVNYPTDFTQQMLDYAKKYSFLPDYN